MWAHPRSRGENQIDSSAGKSELGSSPLTRGKRNIKANAVKRSGLIPAHAGKTRRQPARTSGYRAHPRSRGENHPRAIVSTNHDGSSPLTRGKQEVAA